MTVLITGGAGFIGTHLVRCLLAEGRSSIRVLDNLSRADRPAGKFAGLDFVQGDIRDERQLRRAMNGCEIVFHLAAEATVAACEGRPADAHSSNVTGTYNVLCAAADLGVRRVVFASSREVYGEPAHLPVREDAPFQPKNAYGISKAAAEMHCSRFAESGLEVTSLRLSNVFGPGDSGRVIPRFLKEAAAGRPLMVFGGGQIVDFLWIDTAVNSLLRAGLGTYLPGSINVGSGVGVTVLDTARRIIGLLGSTSEIGVLPARDAEVSRFVADLGRAQKDLGLAPVTDPLAKLTAMTGREMVIPVSASSGAVRGDIAV